MSMAVDMHFKALKAAVAAGDQEAADFIRDQLARAYEDENDAAEGLPSAENFRAGIGRGMVNVARNVGNIAGVVSDEEMAEKKKLDADLLDTKAGAAGNFVGETAATALPAAGAGGLAARVGGRVLGAAAKSAIGRGVVEGATQGALLADPGERLEGALTGGAAGAVLPAALKGYQAARAGVRPTPAAQRLMNEGVDLSPGQMNPQGALNTVEQSLEHVPVVGQMIQGVRGRASDQFERAAIQKGTAPGTNVAQGKADAMLDQAYQSFAPLYDQARGFPINPAVLRRAVGVTNAPVSGAPALPPVAALGKAFADATRSPGVRATAQTRTGVDGFLRQQLTAISKRNLASDDLLDLRSAIRTEARGARRSLDPQEQAAGDLLRRAEAAVTKAITASISKPAARALQIGDQHYRVYKVLEDAVHRAGDQPSGLTPARLSQAVRASTQKGEYARGGGGQLREMASAGREVLEPTAPKTGLLGATTLGTGAALWAKPAIAVPALAGFAALIGTKTGRRAAAGRTRPQLLARELERHIRRTLPKPVREVGSLLGRTAVVGATRE